MWQSRVICVGKIKSNDPYSALQQEYIKRISPKVDLIELDGRKMSNQQSNQMILEKISPKSPLLVFDELGKNLSSHQFSDLIGDALLQKPQPIQFVIGPADGVSDDIRAMADQLISFGKMTWPHLLARILLLEQIYRAQTIMAGHPYHRSN